MMVDHTLCRDSFPLQTDSRHPLCIPVRQLQGRIWKLDAVAWHGMTFLTIDAHTAGHSASPTCLLFPSCAGGAQGHSLPTRTIMMFGFPATTCMHGYMISNVPAARLPYHHAIPASVIAPPSCVPGTSPSFFPMSIPPHYADTSSWAAVAAPCYFLATSGTPPSAF
ncbi:hypothetical protein B0H17DRAFT_1337242 [Mycena rosella]|uniref:Uncharacterized protein n=1 Tax=Mycena rosella TaxID=1033263 RepID=A0AAD7CS41_MYCRO|nr:hypothetical protein B0H17DRAFT_1337242 [Mycena rosella]